ncbi:hypothetical protein K469DRAFT_643052 [Zopfia rhizophila CBS 207.26]|uniref:Uncharacterized protein n=1 Tax=Zopfia rhizophila CBS 207.26 TaxID=1314779 RepID=A0A6A6DL72_9PEZI|nr:hypothetical protein K469DRAFT_643052 [Zopfia rhizophila CBS 207.26]
MVNFSGEPIFCNGIGNSTTELRCCYANNQDSSLCREIFPTDSKLGEVCQSGDCIADCQKSGRLYGSLLQDDPFGIGNGQGPIHRYLTCVNVPAIASYSSQNMLNSNISSYVEPFISPNTTDEELKGVTSTVTACLTQTCKKSRNSPKCDQQCSAVNLLTNNTTPNVQGINDCLYTLCTGRYESLPYADADVIVIGVFSSYIMQCGFVFLLWAGLLAFEVFQRKWKPNSPVWSTPDEAEKATKETKARKHQNAFIKLLLEFHKAQCYFSGTLQIASLSYGVFETDILVTFMLIPLATNGVLPVIFTYLLLVHCGRATVDVRLLTITCWILSTIVYWILYTNLIPIDSNVNKTHAYQQFMYKLSAIPACGNNSALAVCPNNLALTKEPLDKASRKVRNLTPIIWVFSTFVLLSVLGFQGFRRFYKRKSHGYSIASNKSEQEAQNEDSNQTYTLRSGYSSALYWLASICFLAGIGMQLSLLAIGTSLNMMDRKHWSFGQIVAITIWVPPVIGYVYDEVIGFVPKWVSSSD